MRFMMMVIPEGYESAAPDAVPSRLWTLAKGHTHDQRRSLASLQ